MMFLAPKNPNKLQQTKKHVFIILCTHSKSKRSVLAPKMGPFRWVKYSPIFGAKRAHFEWGRFGPNKRGRNSPLLSGQNRGKRAVLEKWGVVLVSDRVEVVHLKSQFSPYRAVSYLQLRWKLAQFSWPIWPNGELKQMFFLWLNWYHYVWNGISYQSRFGP